MQYIAAKLCRLIHERPVSSLDPVTEGDLIVELFRKANLLRYISDGVDISKWVTREEADELLKISRRLAA